MNLDSRPAGPAARTIVLISLYDRGALGVRSLSSFLQQQGFGVTLVYCKELVSCYARAADAPDRACQHRMIDALGADYILGRADPLSAREEKLLLDTLAAIRPCVVGFSVTTAARATAIHLTGLIRRHLALPVIWGGIDATTAPEIAITHADAVCVGEGYHALAEYADALARGGPPGPIANLWLRHGHDIIRRPPRPPIADLDTLPAPDFSPENKYAISGYKLVCNDPSINNDPGTYTIMTARGCPFACTYCCNSQLHALYRGHQYLRRRSVAHVMAELRHAVRAHRIHYIDFYDEVFTLDREWLREFAARYRAEIGIRFWCNVSPRHIDGEALAWLRAAGLDAVTLGIQSGSERMLREVYHRPSSVDEILRGARTLRELGITVYYDLITGNPLATEDDSRATFELLLRLPQRKKFMLGISRLSVFPHTELEKMIRVGELPARPPGLDEFWDRLCLLTQSWLPGAGLRWLSRRRLLRARPGLLLPFFVFAPEALAVRVALRLRQMLPVRWFNFLKTRKNRLLGK